MPNLIPRRRKTRAKIARAKTTTAARLGIVQAALAMATTRLQGVPKKVTRKRRKRQGVPTKGALAGIAGGAALLAGAISAFLKRRQSSTDDTAAASGPAPAPAQSNYDLAGPASNSATAVAAPVAARAATGSAIDEEAEAQAAAAEAAAIGGTSETAPLAGSDPSTRAPDPAEQPVLEGGGGESEGQEQAEAELEDALPVDYGLRASNEGDTDPRARRIEEAIEAQNEPGSGETVRSPGTRFS